MEAILNQLLPLLTTLWWPFCRSMALLTAAPVIGDAMVPVMLRVLVSIALAFILLPAVQGGAAIDPMSMHGVAATIEQLVVGGALGLAFHLSMSVIMVLGYLVSSQMGFAMAVMNDPMNGTSSDVVSGLLSILCIIVFFSIDGHLALTGVLGASFKAWPVGAGVGAPLLQAVAAGVGWVFAAAILLAIPVVFSTLVVQIGFGFLNRVAPSLNLFSLGFSAITLFGLAMLGYIVRFVPEHYIGMSGRVLELIRQQMQVAAHG